MNKFKITAILSVLCLTFSFNASAKQPEIKFEGELPVFKTISLKSYPEIKVPIYRTTGKKGPGVLFIHGNSSSSRTFYKQFYSELGQKYKLFFMDLPGHGLASKVAADRTMPTTADGNWPKGFSEYQEGVLEAVELVANDKDVMAEIVVGWSMGGDVAIKSIGSEKLPNVKGLYIFGTAPADKNEPLNEAPFTKSSVLGELGMPFLPSIGLSFEFRMSSSIFSVDANFADPIPWYAPSSFSSFSTRGDAYLRAFFSSQHKYSELPKFVLEDGFSRSDDRFRSSLAVIALQLDPERENINELEVLKSLEKRDIKIAVGVGKYDLFLNTKYLEELKEQGYLKTLWKDQLIIFKEAGHSPHLETPKSFDKSVADFISSFN